MTLQFLLIPSCSCTHPVKFPSFGYLLHFYSPYLTFSLYHSQLTGTQVEDKSKYIQAKHWYKRYWSPDGMATTSHTARSLCSHSPTLDSPIFLVLLFLFSGPFCLIFSLCFPFHSIWFCEPFLHFTPFRPLTHGLHELLLHREGHYSHWVSIIAFSHSS